MKLNVHFSPNVGSIIKKLSGAPAKYRLLLERELVRIGSDARRTIIQKYRTGGTTLTATALRSGKLRAAYGYEAKVKPGVGTLDVGVTKAANAKVLLYARVQEGFNAAGERVSQFVIRPRRAKFLRFKVYNQRGGLAEKNVEGIVFTKKVILRPRPALVHVKRPILMALRKAPLKAATAAAA